jgi:tetratricopeptide (TPR) repeat protein
MTDMSEFELDDKLYEEIKQLSKVGDDCFGNGEVESAVLKYKEALALLPQPVYEWEAATWLFSAIGDAYWELKDFDKAYDAFYDALKSPDGIGNPFIHLRMGELQVEFGNMEKARDELIRAYMGAGVEIFKYEDSKYLNAIHDLIDEGV